MAKGENDGARYADQSHGNKFAGALLIDEVDFSQSTADVYTGPWVDAAALKEASAQVEVHSALTGTVNIEGTNVPVPGGSSPTFPAADTLTAAGVKMLNVKPVRWIRARVTGFTAGVISVHLHGVK